MDVKSLSCSGRNDNKVSVTAGRESWSVGWNTWNANGGMARGLRFQVDKDGFQFKFVESRGIQPQQKLLLLG